MIEEVIVEEDEEEAAAEAEALRLQAEAAAASEDEGERSRITLALADQLRESGDTMGTIQAVGEIVHSDVVNEIRDCKKDAMRFLEENARDIKQTVEQGARQKADGSRLG